MSDKSGSHLENGQSRDELGNTFLPDLEYSKFPNKNILPDLEYSKFPNINESLVKSVLELNTSGAKI